MGKAWGAVAPLPPALVCDSPGDTPRLALRGSPEDRPLPLSFPGSIGTRPPTRWGRGPAAQRLLRSPGRMKEGGIRMEGIGRGGALASGCQNVRMSGCQNVGMPAMTEAGAARGDGLPDAIEAAREAGGRASQSFPRGRRPALPQHSMPRRGARVKGVWETMERKWFPQCPTHPERLS